MATLYVVSEDHPSVRVSGVVLHVYPAETIEEAENVARGVFRLARTREVRLASTPPEPAPGVTVVTEEP